MRSVRHLVNGSRIANTSIVWPSSGREPVIRNMIRAAALDLEFYNRAEHTTGLTRQAFVVVVLANALAAVGSWIGYENTQDVFGADIWESIRGWLGIGDFPMPGEGGIFVMVGVGILLAIIGWIVWAVITWWIGGRIFKGTTDVGEMLRVLGFAQAPRVIGVIPFLGPVAAVWVLVASVVAIREGLDFSTGRAIGTAIGGWLVWFALQQLVEILIAAIF